MAKQDLLVVVSFIAGQLVMANIAAGRTKMAVVISVATAIAVFSLDKLIANG